MSQPIASFSIRPFLLLAIIKGAASAATPLVQARPGVKLRWNAVAGRAYQVQRLVADSWVNQGQDRPGEGTAQSAAVAVGSSAGSYRVIESTPSQPIYTNALANGGFEQGTANTSAN